MALAAPATAQDAGSVDAGVDPGAVRACFAGTRTGETRPACLGAAARRCQARPGGETTMGLVDCIQGEAAAWDAVLNEEYRATRAALSARGEALASSLLAAQRAWIAYRDAECRLSHDRWGDGTLRGVVHANCILGFTAERSLELRDMRGDGG